MVTFMCLAVVVLIVGMFTAIPLGSLHLKVSILMSTNEQVAARLQALTQTVDAQSTRLTKIFGEVSSLGVLILELREQIANAGGPATQAIEEALTALETKVAALSEQAAIIDELTPDVEPLPEEVVLEEESEVAPTPVDESETQG